MYSDLIRKNKNYRIKSRQGNNVVKTVRVYSIPVATMNDYVRAGANRYGNPEDLTRNVQELVVNKDRGFTFVIDKGDKINLSLAVA